MYKFLLVCFLLIISRTYDITTTYFYTPDLKKESNILVNLFNLNYTHVIIIQIILVGFVIFCFYKYSFTRYILPFNNQMTFKEFIPFFHFKRKEKKISIFYKKISSQSLLHLIGYVVTYSLIWIGFIIGTSTLTLLLSEKYRTIYSKGLLPILAYVLIFTLTILHLIRFYQKKFKEYQIANRRN